MEYNIETTPVFSGLEKADWDEFANSLDDPWWHRTICHVNNAAVRIGVFKGTFHWHKHSEEDEYFHVLEGVLKIDLREKTIELEPNQSVMIPRGVEHRTRADERTVVLMVAQASVQPTGD
jgi:mannose-6-phosphate isomerase-like protein (cupin superfamily)